MTTNQPTRSRPKGPRRKHVPIRTCAVCREKDAKRQFVRIVRTPEATVEIDRTGKKNGRGAYLCTRFRCWESAASGPALERALRTKLDAQTRERLREYADHHFRRDDVMER